MHRKKQTEKENRRTFEFTHVSPVLKEMNTKIQLNFDSPNPIIINQ